jgi:hypothetical protein
LGWSKTITGVRQFIAEHTPDGIEAEVRLDQR